jgi:protein-S-isoprenylcysteine O-methyltransferase Ste14
MTPDFVIDVGWVVWLASWLAAAAWSDRAAKRPAFKEELLYRTLTVAGALLLFADVDFLHQGPFRRWDLGPGADWVLVAIVLFGFIVTWWARLYLGRLWSSSVTKKAEHRIIDTGPYAIVRHPIYTGIIMAIFATAAQKGAPIGIAGAVLMTLGFQIKAKLEERFLREQLGTDAYDSYRRKVPMLIPFGPKSA